MAKRGSRNIRNTRLKRDLNRVASLPAYTPLLRRSFPVYIPLLSIEDNRRSSLPLRTYAPRSYKANPVSVRHRVYRPAGVSSYVARTVGLDAVVCARRSIRREVIFSLGQGGRRGRRGRYRRSDRSNIHCRR